MMLPEIIQLCQEACDFSVSSPGAAITKVSGSESRSDELRLRVFNGATGSVDIFLVSTTTSDAVSNFII